jgi:hypothetical protein
VVGVIVLVGLAGAASARTATPTPGASVVSQAVEDACADADGDGLLTVTDGVLALRAAAGLPSPCTPYRCDVDGNGAITVTDGVGVLQRAAGLIVDELYRCPVPETVHDVSAFAHFRLTREAGFGFCPDLASVLTATIDRQAGGTYVAHLTLGEERPLDDPTCIASFPPYSFGDGTTCIAPVPVLDRVLTAEELARVRSTFAAVRINEARLPMCSTTAFDPCRVTAIQWDGATWRDQFCFAPWIAAASVDDVTAALDALLSAAPTP